MNIIFFPRCISLAPLTKSSSIIKPVALVFTLTSAPALAACSARARSKHLSLKDVAYFSSRDFFCHLYFCTVRGINMGSFKVSANPSLVNFHVFFEVFLCSRLLHSVPDHLSPGVSRSKVHQVPFQLLSWRQWNLQDLLLLLNIVPVLHFITSIAPTGADAITYTTCNARTFHLLQPRFSTSSSAPLGQTPTQAPQYPTFISVYLDAH